MTARRRNTPGDPPCPSCGSACCRYVAMQVDRPRSKSDYDHLRWYLLHEGVAVFVDDEGGWFVEFTTPCSSLGPDGRCREYHDRPRICRGYGEEPGSCEYYDKGYKHRFESTRELERWLDRRGIDWRFKRNARRAAPAS